MAKGTNGSGAEKNGLIKIPNGKPLVSWTSPDFVFEERGFKWYFIVTPIVFMLSALLYWQRIYSGMVLVLVFFFLLIIMSRLKPKEVASSIYDSGVVVDNIVVSYDQIKSFGIVYSNHPKIKLRLNGRFGKEVSMPASGVDLEKLRQNLLLHLPEEEVTEDIADIINRIIKF